MSESVDVVVIGAGVVGLAIARELALQGREVLVLEQHAAFGEETSSRNSEVIHAGIYYPKGSLKALACVRGKELLYRYCDERGVAHAQCGKLIVATDAAQTEVLRQYAQAGAANGVVGLEPIDGAACRELEPNVLSHSGLLSTTTGIIDSHAYMLALLGDLEAAGGLAVFQTQVSSLETKQGKVLLQADGLALDAQWVINATGLDAVSLARTVTTNTPHAYLAVGHYYTYSGPSPFSRLVYPVAEPGGLGVHVTLDLGGGVKFGPDVRWLETKDYGFDDSQRDQFVAAIQRYFPNLEPERLQPGYTGIRPKISSANEPAADFRIDGPNDHGVDGLINLFGIESPGLTASLALAERVAGLVAA